MQQTWDAQNYATNGRFVATLADSLLADLAPQPGERILDLGCGDGFLTEKIAASRALVVGADASPHMVAAATARGLDARCLSGETLPFDGDFQAVFSNAALHWMNNQDAVLKSVHRALKPGGRFVAECGGQGNIAAIRVALLAVLTAHGVPADHIENNRFFAPAEYKSMLEANGFVVDDITLTPRPTPLPSGMSQWLWTFRKSVLDQLPDAVRTTAVDAIVQLLQPVLCDQAGNWTADYVRLRFHAHRY